ncbi:MAG: hypothetical protein KGH59_01580 [Candidatus Micrarchaeota archaeon]|nr:hypothetical protein [Candidatus Micrarchaeota archaeon]MDE1804455.1 hypothetical protein [Candidatus Micrarchaeota archaeon]
MQKSKSVVAVPDANIRAAALIAIFLVLLAIAISVIPKGTKAQQCESILLSQNRDSCLISLAVSTHNQSICSTIQDQSSSQCYSSVAIATLSAPICSKAGNLAASCVVQIANDTNDTSICSQASEPLSDRCVYSIAVRKGGIGFCTQILNSTEQLECDSIISIGYAAASRNPAPCANVTNSTNSTTTSAIITGAKLSSSGSSAIFNQLAFLPELNISARDACYSTVASEQQNASLCAMVGSDARSLCTYSASPATNSTSQQNFTALIGGCNKSGQYASSCRVYVTISEAVATDNATMCGTLSVPSSWNCYSALAVKYKAPADCGYITNSSANNACLQQIG